MNRLTDDLKQNVFTARSTVSIQTLFPGNADIRLYSRSRILAVDFDSFTVLCFNSHQYDKIVNVNMKKV